MIKIVGIVGLLLLVSTPIKVHSHELCVSGNSKQDIEMFTCTDYSRNSCCDASEDSDFQAFLDGLGITGPCLDYLTKIYCSYCDPWSAHLFDAEQGPARTLPLLCDDYCDSFYETCKDENINWPSSPFSSNPISLDWANSTSFCAEYFKADSEFATCYNNTPYVPYHGPDVNKTTSTPICLEYVSEASGYVAMVPANDGTGRLFLLSQYGGDVLILNSQNYTYNKQNFLHIDVAIGNEMGLLGMAVHPDFATNGRFFLHYSSNNHVNFTCTENYQCNFGNCVLGECESAQHYSVISEFTVDPPNSNIASPESERILMTIVQHAGNHNAGTLLFGPDGYLYIPSGDGGNSAWGINAQDMDSLLGKILRIDVDGEKPYEIPDTNPFKDGNHPEIYALGLRNPWKCSFDDVADPPLLFCGDVGQNTLEELDIIISGGNYGWPLYEGTEEYQGGDLPQRIDPIFEYRHGVDVGGNPSIIGGHVYRGGKDNSIYGSYITADYGDAKLFIVSPNENGGWSWNTINPMCSVHSSQCGMSSRIVSFGEDHNKDLYVVHLNAIYKVVEPANCPIVTEIEYTTTSNVVSTTKQILSVSESESEEIISSDSDEESSNIDDINISEEKTVETDQESSNENPEDDPSPSSSTLFSIAIMPVTFFLL
eukprot:TRINITY_DN6687_c0_g1_i1.p1 TRINITY_DN6687_c0_g1~~TRINITY_DN6687_c0_g1_i1.p1  ORF type:complete len:653 (+),score=137.41 TRINITY_DN6687_c0_g1_i1:1-1959(+)